MALQTAQVFLGHSVLMVIGLKLFNLNFKVTLQNIDFLSLGRVTTDRQVVFLLQPFLLLLLLPPSS